MAPVILPTVAVTSDETTPSLSHIINAVIKFVTGHFLMHYRTHLLVSDWITDHLLEVQGWVISHPFYVGAAIVGVVLLIFVLVPWIAPWVALVVNAVWSGLKSAFQLARRSLQWLGRAFVHCLGFGTKGVTRGSTAALYQS